MTIEELDAVAAEREAAALAALLHTCVAAGASIGFVQPFAPSDAEGWWRGQVIPGVARRERRLLAARVGERLAGTAQLVLAAMPNQRHRAEVSKVMVHPDARRRGLARAMMARLEALAAEEGRVLLTLDTREGDVAQPLYASLGYALAGVIPHYARAPDADRLEATAYMFKLLGSPA